MMANVEEEIDEKIEWNLECLKYYMKAMRGLKAFKEYRENDLAEAIDSMMMSCEYVLGDDRIRHPPLIDSDEFSLIPGEKDAYPKQIFGHAALLQCLFDIAHVGGYPIVDYFNDIRMIAKLNDYLHGGPYDDDAKPVASGSVDEMGAQAHTGAACVDHGHGAELQQ